MNRTNTAFLAVVALAAFACAAFAVDPDYTYRESNRTQIMSNIYSVAVTFPGDITVATNLTIAGNAAIQGNANVNGSLTVSTNKVKVGAAGDLETLNSITNWGTTVLNGAINLNGAVISTNFNRIVAPGSIRVIGTMTNEGAVRLAGSTTATNVATLVVKTAATFDVAPAFTLLTNAAAGGSGKAIYLTNAPTGIVNDPEYIKVIYNGSNYCVPAFHIP